MKNRVTSVAPDSSFREIWKLIFNKHIHSLPVCVGRKMVGIIVEKDILSRLYPSYQEFFTDFLHSRRFEDMEDRIADLSGLKAKDVMTTKIRLTYPSQQMMRALSKMLVFGVRQLPVVEETKENILIGMVSRADIFRALYKKIHP